MFTGIVETIGTIKKINKEGSNISFRVNTGITNELKVDQSVCHNGVCLTVTAIEGDSYWVTAVEETLQKSNLDGLSLGSEVNIERCMQLNGRFDGHIVQGHVDTTATVLDIIDKEGSWIFKFRLNQMQGIIVEKGSICLNGISLTCFDVAENQFSVAIIPYTFEHTNFRKLKKRSIVNVEFDIIGKYLEKLVTKPN